LKKNNKIKIKIKIKIEGAVGGSDKGSRGN